MRTAAAAIAAADVCTQCYKNAKNSANKGLLHHREVVLKRHNFIAPRVDFNVSGFLPIFPHCDIVEVDLFIGMHNIEKWGNS